MTVVNFYEVDLSATFDDSAFSFSPPDDFSITDYSEGVSKIKRFPVVMRDGKKVSVTQIGKQLPIDNRRSARKSPRMTIIVLLVLANSACLALILKKAKPRLTN
jgi:hypothetical protein